MDGHHFHNTDPNHEGERFIVETFFKNLETGTVKLPDGPDGELIDVPIKDLGIHHPVIITALRISEPHVSAGGNRREHDGAEP